MRKLALLFAIFYSFSAYGATWWTMPTICRPSNIDCYASMGAGYDAEIWDNNGNCRGEKIVCPKAIIGTTETSPVPLSKNEILDTSMIDVDFDLFTYDSVNACFGVRKTRNNGTNAKVGSTWRNVYCNGVLDNPDEYLPNGEIVISTEDQPTCQTLSENGYIGILNNGCYGKFGYPATDFYVECGETNLIPNRIFVLNGTTGYRLSTEESPTPSSYPITEDVAKAVFDHMTEAAASARTSYTTGG